MPITYQWRRDGVDIADTPPGTSTSSTYTLVQADEGAVIDCVVTASNNIGSDATVTVVAPRLISDNSLIGNYEWDYAWAANDAPSTPGTLPDYQGGIDADLQDGLTYFSGQYTGRLLAADIGSARIDASVRPNVEGNWRATSIPAPAATDSVHVRVIFRSPKNPSEISSLNLLNLAESSGGDRYALYLNNAPGGDAVRFHSQTIGFTSNDVLTADISIPNQWVIWDTYIDPGNEHWQGINGVQYTDSSPAWSGFSGTSTLNANDILSNFDFADDSDFLFLGIRIGKSFTFAEHESDYLSTDLSLPYPSVLPEISGSLTVGSQLSVSDGYWEGEATVTFGYQWTRDGGDISGATSSTYTLVALDAGTHIGCRVTGTNASLDTYTLDVSGGVVEEGDALELAWEHAWAAPSGSRQSLIDGIKWDYAWSFDDRTSDDINPLAGSRTLAYQNGAYTGSASTGPLLDAAIGASRSGGAVDLAGSGGARWNATDVNVGDEDVHIRLIMERPTANAGSFFFWGDFGAPGARNDYFWITYQHNADPQLARFTVIWYHNNSANQRFLYPDDANGWCLLDIVLKDRDDGNAELLAWCNGGNVNFSTSDGALDTNDPFRGVPGNFLQINRAQNLDAAILFAGVRAGAEATNFTENDHRAAFASSGILELFNYHTWDHAWDFSGATANSNISAYAGTVDLVRASGNTAPGALTGPFVADNIGASRVDDALACTANPNFSVTGNTITGGYHLRIAALLKNRATQVLLDAPGIDIRLNTFNQILFDVTGWTTATVDYEDGWHLIDVSVWNDGGSLTVRIHLDGVEVSGVTSSSFTFNALGANWDVLHSGGSNHFDGSILFLGVRELESTFDSDRAQEAYLAATGKALLQPLEPLVAGSVFLDAASGSTGKVEQATTDLVAADIGNLTGRAINLDGDSFWTKTDAALAGAGERHYRLLLAPRWGRAPATGRVFGAGSTADDYYLIGYVNEDAELVIEVNPDISVTAKIDRDRWSIVDIVTWDDTSDAVLSVYINGVEYESRNAGSHGQISGSASLGGYNDAAGYIGDVLFYGWREAFYAKSAHDTLYESTALRQDVIEEYTWNYAYDLSQAPSTPGNIPELNGGVELTLTGSYTTGGSTTGIDDAVIGLSRVDDALTPGASTSFDGNDRRFTLDLQNGVHIRFVADFDPTDPSGTLFQLGDTSTGSGITIIRRESSNDNFRFTTRTTSGSANDYDVSTTGLNGWAVVDFYIRPDGANTDLEVIVDGTSSTSTWSQEWLGVDQTALTINLDNRENFLFVGVRSLERNILIDSYAWTHAWDWSQAPSSPGTVPAYVGGVDASLQTGTYTTGSSTGGLTARDIGQDRVGEAITPAVNNLHYVVTDASLVTTEKVHFRGLVRPNENSYLFMEGDLTNPYVRYSIHPSLGSQWQLRERNALLTMYDPNEPGQWVLVDAVFGDDGGGGTKVELMVNGQYEVQFDSNPYNGMDNSWQFFILAVGASLTFDGDVLFYGFRFGEDFTFAEHVRDFRKSGLAHLWANLEWDHAWDFSEAPSTAGDIPAYAGTVDLTASTPTYTIDQPTKGWTDEALGSAVDKAVLITGTGRNWESVNASLTHADPYRVRLVARTPESGSTSTNLFEYYDDTSNTRDGPRIYTNEAAANAQQRLHGQHFDGATVATENIDKPSQGQWSLVDFIVDDSNVRLFTNGIDSGNTSNPSTAAIGDEIRFDGEDWTMLFLGVQKLSASSELDINVHRRHWRAARRQNVIDRYDWTHSWSMENAPRDNSSFTSDQGLVTLDTVPSSPVYGQSTGGLITDAIGSLRQDRAVGPGGTGSWQNSLVDSDLETSEAIHMRVIFRWSGNATIFSIGSIGGGGAASIIPSGLNRFRCQWSGSGVGTAQVLGPTVWTPGQWILADVNFRSDGASGIFVEAFVNGLSEGSAQSSAGAYAGIPVGQGRAQIGNVTNDSILFVGARYGRQISFEEHEEDYGYLV